MALRGHALHVILAVGTIAKCSACDAQRLGSHNKKNMHVQRYAWLVYTVFQDGKWHEDFRPTPALEKSPRLDRWTCWVPSHSKNFLLHGGNSSGNTNNKDVIMHIALVDAAVTKAPPNHGRRSVEGRARLGPVRLGPIGPLCDLGQKKKNS